MNRLFSAKPLLAAAVALGAVGAASAAHAGDLALSIGFASPAYVAPAPVYVQPEPVYVQPRPVYVQPSVTYYGYNRYVERRGPYGDWDRDGIPNRFDRDSRWYDPRAGHHHQGWRDSDRDGVPNRFDPAPHNPYRR
jgi:hypothetical protein